MNGRLPAGVEVAGFLRSVQGAGGFATILHRGDPDRGEISLLVTERGRPAALLERRLAANFVYRWTEVPPSAPLDGAGWREWVDRKSRIDPDFWLVELDVADAQRFIAEMTAAG